MSDSQNTEKRDGAAEQRAEKENFASQLFARNVEEVFQAIEANADILRGYQEISRMNEAGAMAMPTVAMIGAAFMASALQVAPVAERNIYLGAFNRLVLKRLNDLEADPEAGIVALDLAAMKTAGAA